MSVKTCFSFIDLFFFMLNFGWDEFQRNQLEKFRYTHLFWLLYRTEGATEAVLLKTQNFVLDFPIQASFN